MFEPSTLPALHALDRRGFTEETPDRERGSLLHHTVTPTSLSRLNEGRETRMEASERDWAETAWECMGVDRCAVCMTEWPYHLPVHVVTISAFQIGLFYTIDTVTSFGTYVPITLEEGWRVLTCALAHADATHLWNNMIVQLTAGSIFEMLHGSIACAIVYWLSSIFGVAFQLALWPADERTVLVGASAAGYGVLAAYAAHLAMNWTETPLRVVWFVSVVFIAAAEVITYLTNPESRVAHGAHAGGALYGFCVGLMMVRNVRIIPCERWVWWLALAAATAGLVILTVVTIGRMEE
jgi:membrane associated rhomboid family serine protease